MQNDKRQFLGIWIPREIYLNKDLTWTEKILLVEIKSLDNDKGCFASNDYFAEFLSCTTTTISTSISKLKKLNFIKQVSFDGRTRILKSEFKFSQRQSLKKFKGRTQKNLKHNNTDNNTIIKKEKIIKKDFKIENSNNGICINVEQLKENQIWLDSVSIHLQLIKQTTSQLLLEFISEQKLKDDVFKSLKETKSHFLNWAKIQVAKKRKFEPTWGRVKKTFNTPPKKEIKKPEISETEKKKLHETFIREQLINPFNKFCETGHLQINNFGGIIFKELKKHKLLIQDKNKIEKLKQTIDTQTEKKQNGRGGLKRAFLQTHLLTPKSELDIEIIKISLNKLKSENVNLEKILL